MIAKILQIKIILRIDAKALKTNVVQVYKNIYDLIKTEMF